MDASASTSLWVTLGLLTALGFRHGLDPDHIAAVDGLTRMRYRESAGTRPPVFGVARLAGFQFACGHSLNIFLVTLVFYWQDFELPQWLESTGLWLSTAFCCGWPLPTCANAGSVIRTRMAPVPRSA